jgi:hypothetical protein
LVERQRGGCGVAAAAWWRRGGDGAVAVAAWRRELGGGIGSVVGQR